jgi:S-adenosylmethionine:tRNA ribosyltransferase-isomerase
VLVSDFNFHLPEELIAQEPLADRAASRMLCLNRASGTWKDDMFANLPELLRSDDLLVFNNTRVFPARLYGRRAAGEAKIEVLLTRQISSDPNEWECLVRPGKKVGVGERLYFGDGLEAEVVARAGFGERQIRFLPVPDFFGQLEISGHVPLPPYIARDDRANDRQRYQTIFAKERGSVAAPTAGLHFTPEILDAIRARGIETVELTLHVGLGTFQPIRAECVEDVKLHRERFSITEDAANAINQARREHRRVVAVGTTTVRTLEYAALQSSEIQPGSGEADIFIYPGHKFRMVNAMLTNFHLPQSSLLILVCAFAGKESVLNAYGHAVESKYRFYSYGDCMFLE